MGLKGVLAKLKLIEPGETTPPGARGGASRGEPGDASSIDLETLLARMPEPRRVDDAALSRARATGAPARPAAASSGPHPADEADDAEDASALPIPDFDALYLAAGVEAPSHGFTAFKVLEILSAPEFAALDGKAKAAALGAFLKMNPSGPVAITDVIEDAVRRDQALDQFEDFLRQKLKQRSDEIEAENATLQAELEDLMRRHRERIEANRARIDAQRAQFEAWLERKHHEEERLARSVEPFVEGDPISTRARPRA